MAAVYHRSGTSGEIPADQYQGNVLRAWADFAAAADQSPLFGLARGALGTHRAAYAAVLDCYFRSLPQDGHRLEADHEYFYSRVHALLRELAPPQERRVDRRLIARSLRDLRREGVSGGHKAELLRAVVRLSTSSDTALQAHDAYREYRSRVAPQFTDRSKERQLA